VKDKKILFVTTHFSPDFHFGGVVESGTKIFKYLKKKINISLITVSKYPIKYEDFLDSNDRIIKSNIFHSWGFSFNLIISLFNKIKESNFIIVNGIVTFPTTLAALYCIILKKDFIVATRGGLEPWRRNKNKIKKIFYFKFITIPLIRRAKYIHVTSETEKNNLKKLGFYNTINVSNGIDLDDYGNLPNRNTSKFIKDYNKKNLLFLSRMDKEKGLDILLESFELYNNNNLNLILAGPDDRSYLSNFNISKYKSSIEYIGPVYGVEKINLLRSVDFLILPSYSENFGNVIAESLACETTVLTTNETPWIELENLNCGLIISPNKKDLFQALKKINDLDVQTLNLMGTIGRKYIIENFSWEKKSNDLIKFIQ
jgi:glycosyltransferase involved in cell wall biosynthesis